MSTFEPTQAEKDALTYLEWDDAALGRFVKHVACTLHKVQGDSDGLHKVTAASCAMMLVGIAVDANAETVRLAMDGHTHQEIPTGDWVVTVQRTKAAPTDGADSATGKGQAPQTHPQEKRR
jgi:hypothetical protein